MLYRSAVQGFEPRYGWAAADAHAAFKICAHAVVDGEPTFLTVTTAEGEDGVLVTERFKAFHLTMVK